MAFGIARRELGERACPCQAIGVGLAGAQIKVDLCQIWMRRQRPYCLDDFRRLAETALAGENSRSEGGRGYEIGHCFENLPAETERLAWLLLLFFERNCSHQDSTLPVPQPFVDQTSAAVERGKGAFPIFQHDMLFENGARCPGKGGDIMCGAGKMMRCVQIPAPLSVGVEAAEAKKAHVFALGHLLECSFDGPEITGKLGSFGLQKQGQRLFGKMFLRLGSRFDGKPCVTRADGDETAGEGSIAFFTSAGTAGNRQGR